MKIGNSAEGMSVIVKTIACVLAIPITVFGLYVVLHGHLTPGGGFAGGAIVATLVALFLVSFGKEATKALNRESLFILANLGLLAFIGLAFLGLGSTFFQNFLAESKGLFQEGGTVFLMELAVGLVVFSALSLVLLLFAGSKEGEK